MRILLMALTVCLLSLPLAAEERDGSARGGGEIVGDNIQDRGEAAKADKDGKQKKIDHNQQANNYFATDGNNSDRDVNPLEAAKLAERLSGKEQGKPSKAESQDSSGSQAAQ